MLYSKASFLKSIKEAIDPSSGSTMAERTDIGRRPARTTRSTEASVWPALLRTPPSRYLRGKTWPGLRKFPGLESGDDKARTVFALSEADTPVDVPAFTSYTRERTKKLLFFFFVFLSFSI